jgi:hypothetical protein
VPARPIGADHVDRGRRCCDGSSRRGRGHEREEDEPQRGMPLTHQSLGISPRDMKISAAATRRIAQIAA